MPWTFYSLSHTYSIKSSVARVRLRHFLIASWFQTAWCDNKHYVGLVCWTIDVRIADLHNMCCLVVMVPLSWCPRHHQSIRNTPWGLSALLSVHKLLLTRPLELPEMWAQAACRVETIDQRLFWSSIAGPVDGCSSVHAVSSMSWWSPNQVGTFTAPQGDL